jgi:hypothetical protein
MVDPELYAKIVTARFGGLDSLFDAAEKAVAHAVATWEQDADQIGRVVRAHLYVEHFLTVYVDALSPGLNEVDDARLSFSQKAALVPDSDPVAGGLLPGLQRLNAIRNRVAHTLRADLTCDDKNVFKGVELFRAMKVASGDGQALEASPLEIVESFARFAGSMLSACASHDGEKWSPVFSPEEVAAARGSK